MSALVDRSIILFAPREQFGWVYMTDVENGMGGDLNCGEITFILAGTYGDALNSVTALTVSGHGISVVYTNRTGAATYG